MRQDYEIEQQEDEDLRCPICNYYFSNTTKPFLLPCNHNLCSQCLIDLWEKAMYSCPICRKAFNKGSLCQFKVNFSFLSLVNKILKTKVIYCNHCQTVFNWTEHQLVCDQRLFKEPNEIMGEIGSLTEECIHILTSIGYYQTLVLNSKEAIFKEINMMMGKIADDFKEKSQEAINKLYNDIPKVSLESYCETFSEYLKRCKPLFHLMKSKQKDIDKLITENDSQSFSRHRKSVDNTNFHLGKALESGRSNTKPIELHRNIDTYCSYRKNISNSIRSYYSHTESKQATKLLEEEAKLSDIEDILNSEIEDTKEESTALHNKREEEKKICLKTDTTQNKINEKISILNHVLSLVNITKQSVYDCKSYSRRIEYKDKTLKEQISINQMNYFHKITLDLHSIIDNITLSAFPTAPRQFLINYIENTKKIWLYDSLNNTCVVRECPQLKTRFNQTMGIEFDQYKTMYITGGKFPTSIFTEEVRYEDEFYIIKVPVKAKGACELVINHSGKMPRKRANHSSLFHEDKLYLIGGESDMKARLKECECFNSIEKKWELLPSLNCSRIKPGLCIYNNTLLYAFQGDSEINAGIEFIAIAKDFSEGWVSVYPEDPASVWVPTNMSSVTVVDKNQILICGGLSHRGMVKYSYLYNPLKKVICRSNDICHSAVFSSNGVIHNDKLILIDITSDSGKRFGFHMYDIQHNQWSYY